MAAAVGHEETDRPTAWPIFVIPGGWVISLDAASQCLQPFPEEIGRLLHILFRENVLDDN